jgi:hypothetical protein
MEDDLVVMPSDFVVFHQKMAFLEARSEVALVVVAQTQWVEAELAYAAFDEVLVVDHAAWVETGLSA